MPWRLQHLASWRARRCARPPSSARRSERRAQLLCRVLGKFDVVEHAEVQRFRILPGNREEVNGLGVLPVVEELGARLQQLRVGLGRERVRNLTQRVEEARAEAGSTAARGFRPSGRAPFLSRAFLVLQMLGRLDLDSRWCLRRAEGW